MEAKKYINYLSCENDGNFNILSNNQEINIDEYKILDKIVAKLLEEPISNIIEK